MKHLKWTLIDLKIFISINSTRFIQNTCLKWNSLIIYNQVIFKKKDSSGSQIEIGIMINMIKNISKNRLILRRCNAKIDQNLKFANQENINFNKMSKGSETYIKLIT